MKIRPGPEMEENEFLMAAAWPSTGTSGRDYDKSCVFPPSRNKPATVIIHRVLGIQWGIFWFLDIQNPMKVTQNPTASQ